MKMHINLDFRPGYQPPKEEGIYYCITTESGLIQSLPYSPKHTRFNNHDWDKNDHGAILVRWWAPVPKAIKVHYGKGMNALTMVRRP